jgi:hypothetical protein
MTENLKVGIAFALLVLIPVALIWTPVVWYGKRRGWGTRQYAQMMVVCGVLLFAFLGLFVLHFPLRDVVTFSLLILVLGAFYAKAMITWDSRRR